MSVDTFNAFTLLRQTGVPWEEALASASATLDSIAEWYFAYGWELGDFLDACRDAFERANS